MTRIGIGADEWYPVHVIEEPDGAHYAEIDIDNETLARWKSGFAAFHDLQVEIEAVASKERAK